MLSPTSKSDIWLYSHDLASKIAAPHATSEDKIYRELNLRLHTKACFHLLGLKRIKHRLLPKSININPFHIIVLFLYLLKTSENLRFSDVLRGYGEGPTRNGLHDEVAHYDAIILSRCVIFVQRLFVWMSQILLWNHEQKFVTFKILKTNLFSKMSLRVTLPVLWQNLGSYRASVFLWSTSFLIFV